MKKADIYIPSEQLRYISQIDKKGSKWYMAVYKGLETLNPNETSEKELSEKDTVLAENVITALQELNKWAERKKIGR
ncbi:MAG: hypothetical protein IJ744_09505 [Lachnospiraceae bacterium]|nr:hypothetical protein [Lachnospiraceae bacterium]